MSYDGMDGELEVVNQNLELEQMPLSAVAYETLEEIRKGLLATVTKVVDNGMMADIKGLIDFLGFKERAEIIAHPAPFMPLIDIWQATPQHPHRPSAGKLIEILHTFERYDILYEITPHIQKDLERWRAKLQRIKQYEENNFTNLPKELPDPIDPKPVVSVDGIETAEEEEYYDAMFSYANDDYSEYIMDDLFASLSQMYRLKLFRKVGDAQLQKIETLKYINKKCGHVIVLLSQSYLESEECYAALYYMTYKDPMAFARKIIPVLIENIKPPELLMDRVCVKYYRKDEKRRCLQSIYETIRKQKARR